MPTLKISQEILNIIYPVGSVYISTNSANPATLFGGTWEQIKGRFLVGCGSNGVDLYIEAGQTGGEATHTLTVDEMPRHNHNAYLYGGNLASAPGRLLFDTGAGQEYYNSIKSAGGDKPHNNMPPYLAVYMWYRTA